MFSFQMRTDCAATSLAASCLMDSGLLTQS
jgi:hypothetical protein